MCAAMSLEDALYFQIKCCGLPEPVRQFRFDKTRRWKSDFCWPDHQVIVEVEGAVWTNGRHTRGGGFIKDCEKYNSAVLKGYKVLRVTGEHIRSGDAVDWISKILN